MKKLYDVLIEPIVWFFVGLTVIYTPEEDPELWDNPRKKARIRRRWERERRKERRKNGKKTNV